MMVIYIEKNKSGKKDRVVVVVVVVVVGNL